MSLFKEFSTLFPYLQSIRRLEEYISFDVSFSSTWKLPKKFVREDRVLEQESKTTGQRLFSFISTLDEKSVEETTNNIQNIINYNLEREEKEKLFNLKVEELKQIFEKQPLKTLKNLKFEFTTSKIRLDNEDEDIQTTTVVSE